MRYRRLDADGDMTFGRSQGDFWINQPEAVAQLVLTRLRLTLGEWFHDTSDGTAWNTQVLGVRTQPTRDIVVIDRARGTDGLAQIDTYGSVLNPNTREWTAAMKITTVYGPIALVAPKLPATVPPLGRATLFAEGFGPAYAATKLGLEGGTPLTATPADLTEPGRANITAFSVSRLAVGSY